MIKESPSFPFDSLGYQVNIVAREMRAVLNARLAEQGVTFATWTALIALATQGGMIQRDLANAIEVEGPTLVRRLDAMEAAGLVERQPVAGDRRATRVVLTPHGATLYERVKSAVQKAEADVLAGVDPADLATTRRVLAALIERTRSMRR